MVRARGFVCSVFSPVFFFFFFFSILLTVARARHAIAVSEPRRLAAIELAKRVAVERGSVLGDEVGYSVRFDHCWHDERTRLKFLSDGALVREIMGDPLLSRYSVVMVDEAHERHLDTDVLLGLLKKIQRKRRSFRLVVASATLDAAHMHAFLNRTRSDGGDSCCIVSVDGRQFAVDVHYALAPVADYVLAALDAVLAIQRTQAPGDVLVFLTGQQEIDELVAHLREQAPTQLLPLPLHAQLAHADQQRVFAPAPRGVRKVIVATNVAEASLTIDGVVYVVDSGFVKLRTFDPHSGCEALVVTPESQASARQRAGRAGRVQPGKCYRLFTEAAFDTMPVHTTPEMQRTALDRIVLDLKALGIDNVLRFDFPSPPPVEALLHALELLYALGTIDESGALTPLGAQCGALPLAPPLAVALLRAHERDVTEELLSIVAMTTVDQVFADAGLGTVDAGSFAVLEGDHLSLLNVFTAYSAAQSPDNWCGRHRVRASSLRRAAQVRSQLRAALRSARAGAPPDEAAAAAARDEDLSTRVRKALVVGLFPNAACLGKDGSYRTIRGKDRLFIHPSSVLFRRPPTWLVFQDVEFTKKQFLRDVTAIEPEWLVALSGQFYEFKTQRDAQRMGVSMLFRD
jgi:ATP-dependent RNA helicase DDX35